VPDLQLLFSPKFLHFHRWDGEKSLSPQHSSHQQVFCNFYPWF
jgi:hypothetical protein